ncbi:hypothetical protein B7463_g12051, partial [Scytalidium lignicola]
MATNAAVVDNEEKYIPTIDLRGYFEPTSPTSKAEVVEQVKRACLDHGFFQVVGHGVPVESQRRMLAACKTFFDLPKEKKTELALQKFSWRRGYEGPGQQKANDPHHGDALPDQKEGFFVGNELPLHKIGPLKGPNIWPPELAESDFRQPVEEYYKHSIRVGYMVMEVLIVSLGYSASILDTFTHDPAMYLKLLRYPEHNFTDPRQFGSGQHTDYGGLTILLQHPGQDGLEVWHAATQQWIALPALEDKFVINLGDLIQRWTGGVYKSTLHRVINKTGDERFAVPAFWHGDLDTTNPFDPHDNKDTVVEFILKKFNKGYGLPEIEGSA